MDYIVVYQTVDNSDTNFEDEINTKLKEGWKLQGGVSIHYINTPFIPGSASSFRVLLAQALIKE